jgi:hypothetical protein
MGKLQFRNTRNIRKQGNVTPPKVHHSAITEFKDIEMIEISGKNSKV